MAAIIRDSENADRDGKPPSAPEKLPATSAFVISAASESSNIHAAKHDLSVTIHIMPLRARKCAGCH